MSPNDPSARYFIASGCPIATTSLYRCVHLQEQLQALGHEAAVVNWFDSTRIDPAQALACDMIVLYRLAMSPPLASLIDQLRQSEKPVIFDTDDLVFEPDLVAWHRAVKKLGPKEQVQHLDGVRCYLMTLLACDAVTVATPPLAELAAKRGKPAFVHRNALGNEMQQLAGKLYEQRKSRSDNSRIIVGYGSGTATHEIDFLETAGALETILGRYPQVELWIVGPLELPSALQRFGARVRRYPLSSWQDWFRLMAKMDLVLAPLELDNIFCRAKSEIKFVEAGAIGLPVVATDIDPYRDAITHGKDGFLAATGQEWTQALSRLIEAPRLRAGMGRAARETVMQKYGPSARTRELAGLLDRLDQTLSHGLQTRH
jgi:glycosyltransferase involved in cell wall biosynthesis